jgi:transcriptional regulator with XRE-family HTH domain
MRSGRCAKFSRQLDNEAIAREDKADADEWVGRLGVRALEAPTVRRRRLALELRRLRESARLTCEEAARKLEFSVSKISRVESGRAAVSPRDVYDISVIYGASLEERGHLIQLARDAQKKGWWEAYRGAIEPHFAAYLDLESVAVDIRTYEVGLIPGLLQTPEYARAAISIGMLAGCRGDAEGLVRLAVDRRPALTAADAPRFWAVLDEAALRREVGGPLVMREQLEHLLALARLPNVELQVIPFESGAHPALGRSFLILSFADPADPDVVYLEDLTSALYLEAAAEVDRYNTSFDHLRAAALSFADSAALIAGAIGRAAPGPAAAAHMTPRLARLAVAAENARAESEVLCMRNAAMAQALAVTEDSMARILERLVSRNPDDARLRATSVAARNQAARQRQRALGLRRRASMD